MKKTTTSWRSLSAKLLAAVVAVGTVIGLAVVGGASAQTATSQADSATSKAAQPLSSDVIGHKPGLTKLMGYNASASWTTQGLRADLVLRVGHGDVSPQCVKLATGAQGKDVKSASEAGLDEQGKCGLQLFVGDGADAKSKNMMRPLAYMNTLQAGKEADNTAQDLAAAKQAFGDANGNFFTIHSVAASAEQGYDDLTIGLKTDALKSSDTNALRIYAVVNDGEAHAPVALDDTSIAGADADVAVPDDLENSGYAAELIEGQALNADGMSWCGDQSSITCATPAAQAQGSAKNDAASKANNAEVGAQSSNSQISLKTMLNYVSRVEVPGSFLRADFVLRVPHHSVNASLDKPGISFLFSKDGKRDSALVPTKYVKSMGTSKGAADWAKTPNVAGDGSSNAFTIHSVNVEPVASGEPEFDDVSVSIKGNLDYSSTPVNESTPGGVDAQLYLYATQSDNVDSNATGSTLDMTYAAEIAEPLKLYSSATCADTTSGCNGPRLGVGKEGAVDTWWDISKSGSWKSNNSQDTPGTKGDSANWGLDTSSGLATAGRGFSGDTAAGIAPSTTFMNLWYNPASPSDPHNNVPKAAGKHDCSQVGKYFFQWVGLNRDNNWVPVKDLTPTAQENNQVVVSSPDNNEYGYFTAFNKTNTSPSFDGRTTDPLVAKKQGSSDPAPAQLQDGSIDFAMARIDQPELTGYFKLVAWPETTNPNNSACSANQDVYNPLAAQSTGSKGILSSMQPSEANEWLAKGWSVNSAFYNFNTFTEIPTIDTPADNAKLPEVYKPSLTGHGTPGDKVLIYRQIDGKGFTEQDTKDVIVGSNGIWQFKDTNTPAADGNQHTYQYRVQQVPTTLGGGRDMPSDFSAIKTLTITPVDHKPMLFKMLNYFNRMDTGNDKLRMDFVIRVAHGDVDYTTDTGYHVETDKNGNQTNVPDPSSKQKTIGVYYDFNGGSGHDDAMRKALYTRTIDDYPAAQYWANAQSSDPRFTINSVLNSGVYDYLNVSIKADVDYTNDELECSGSKIDPGCANPTPDQISKDTPGGTDYMQYVYVTTGEKAVAAADANHTHAALNSSARTVDVANTFDADQDEAGDHTVHHYTTKLYASDDCDDQTSGCNGPRIAAGPIAKTGQSVNVDQTWNHGESNWALVTDNGYSQSPQNQLPKGVAPMNSFWSMWYDMSLPSSRDPEHDGARSKKDNRQRNHPCSEVDDFYFQWLGLDHNNNWVPVKDLTPTAQLRSQQQLSHWSNDKIARYSSMNGELNSGNFTLGTNNMPYQLSQNLLSVSDTPNTLSPVGKDPADGNGGGGHKDHRNPTNYPNMYAPAQLQNRFGGPLANTASGDIDFAKAKADQPELTGYFKMVTWPVTTNPQGVKQQDNSSCSTQTQAAQDIYNPIDRIGDPSDKGITLDKVKNHPDQVNKLLDESWTNNSAYFRYDVPRPNALTVNKIDGSPFESPSVARTITGSGAAKDSTVMVYRERNGATGEDVSGDDLVGEATVNADGTWSIVDADANLDITNAANRTIQYRARQTQNSGYHLTSAMSNAQTVTFKSPKPSEPPTFNGENVVGSITYTHTVNGKLPQNAKLHVSGTYSWNEDGASVKLCAQAADAGYQPVDKPGTSTPVAPVCNTVPVTGGTWSVDLDENQFNNGVGTNGNVTDKRTHYVLTAVLVNKDGVESDPATKNAVLDMRAPNPGTSSAGWNGLSGTAWHASDTSDNEPLPDGFTVQVTWPSGSTTQTSSKTFTGTNGKWSFDIPKGTTQGDVKIQVTDKETNQSGVETKKLNLTRTKNLPITGGWWALVAALLAAAALAFAYFMSQKRPQKKHSMKSIGSEGSSH
ncbi:hypothetical protein OZX67_00510 [Bifidobacterium sp. ESL0728]|uniref:hypothetical protein n=1 Tax=Bifidobacterium sp. ESL0728 TaxID=2983220 RepID=UPI0023F6AF37|nr:hypothetical protein [Bifidobacterium sp. ESL0728]WEV59101.1 hypothetical protein OZX67_00510 [Bifidobacterium sp. ESL0728]